MKGRGILKRTKKETITESSRTTRVKLYKSGKQWVQCLLTRVGLLKIATHPAPPKVQLDESEANLDSKSTTLLKGVLAAGAMIGGGTVASTGALAATTTGVQTTATNNAANSALANTDHVSLTQGTTSQVTSTSGSLSTSETSTSTSATSTSASLTSNSTSAKEPASTTSTTSQTMSGTATSATSQTINANSLVATTAPTTSNVDQLKQLVAQANTFMATDSYKNADSDYRQAYQAAIAQYQAVLAKNQVSESDASYGLSELQTLMTAIDAGATPNQLATPMVLASTPASSGLVTPDTNTKAGDTKAYWFDKEGSGGFKYIQGADRLWSNVDVHTSLNAKDFTSKAVDSNLQISTKQLDDGKTKWTITFFPKKGLDSTGNKSENDVYGLSNGQMGFYLTKDYKIIGDINIHVSAQPGTSYKINGMTGLPDFYTVDGWNKSVPSEASFDFNGSQADGRDYWSIHNKDFAGSVKTTNADRDWKLTQKQGFATNQYIMHLRYADRSIMNDSTFNQVVFTNKGSENPAAVEAIVHF